MRTFNKRDTLYIPHPCSECRAKTRSYEFGFVIQFRVGIRYLIYRLLLAVRGDALLDDNDEDELAGIENNNPPGHAKLPVDD